MAAVARPRPSNGETLHERSKGKDVRISNIVAAKVRPRSVGQSLALQPAVRGRHWEATVRGRGGRGGLKISTHIIDILYSHFGLVLGCIRIRIRSRLVFEKKENLGVCARY